MFSTKKFISILLLMFAVNLNGYNQINKQIDGLYQSKFFQKDTLLNKLDEEINILKKDSIFCAKELSIFEEKLSLKSQVIDKNVQELEIILDSLNKKIIKLKSPLSFELKKIKDIKYEIEGFEITDLQYEAYLEFDSIPIFYKKSAEREKKINSFEKKMLKSNYSVSKTEENRVFIYFNSNQFNNNKDQLEPFALSDLKIYLITLNDYYLIESISLFDIEKKNLLLLKKLINKEYLSPMTNFEKNELISNLTGINNSYKMLEKELELIKNNVEIIKKEIEKENIEYVKFEQKINKLKSKNNLDILSLRNHISNKTRELREITYMLKQLKEEKIEIQTEKKIFFEKQKRLAEFNKNLSKKTFGSQVWTTKNLNVDHFINGDTIFHCKTNEQLLYAQENKIPCWCYYNNDPSTQKKMGKLYNVYAIIDSNRSIFPDDWHIPSHVDVEVLIEYLGGSDEAADRMKSSFGWKPHEMNKVCPRCKGGTKEFRNSCYSCKGHGYLKDQFRIVSNSSKNPSGFNAFPNGHRALNKYEFGVFNDFTHYGCELAEFYAKHRAIGNAPSGIGTFRINVDYWFRDRTPIEDIFLDEKIIPYSIDYSYFPEGMYPIRLVKNSSN